MQHNIEMDKSPREENVTNSSQQDTDKEALLTFVQQIKDRLRERAQARELNTNISKQCPEKARFTSLDSSVKKNTAFVRKLKHFTSSQLPSILVDFSSLNLTKYISEVAAAIVEAKLKINDVDSAVQLCNALHRTYADFSGHLFRNWQKALMIKRDAKGVNVSKLRVDLRFFAECVAVGLFAEKDGPPTLNAVLSRLVSLDKDQHNYASVLVNFCRHCGHDFAGLVPSNVRRTARALNVSIPRSCLASVERQKAVHNLLKDYYRSLCTHLLHTHQKLTEYKAQNRRILQMREDLGPDRRAVGDDLALTLGRLAASAAPLAALLDVDPPPVMEEGGEEPPPDQQLRVVGGGGGGGWEGTEGGGGDLWEDEETRMFYEELPEVAGRGRQKLPPEELPEPLEDPEDMAEELRETAADLEDIPEEEEEEEEEDDDRGDSQSLRDGETPRNGKTLQGDREVPLNEACQNRASPNEVSTQKNEASPQIASPGGRGEHRKAQRSAFLSDLVKCVNKEMIDRAAVEFVDKFNTKANRKRLTVTLAAVSWRRLDLLPLYARLAAAVRQVAPEVAADLAAALRQEFKYHVRKKDQLQLWSKVKTVRYVGELVKFSLYSRVEALHCVRVLLADFVHHNVDMCCHLLETCGRFLYRHEGAHERTHAYLEQMMRKKAVLPLDSRYVTMIESAFYHICPPSSSPSCSAPSAPLPPPHAFLRRLIRRDLCAAPAVDPIARAVSRADWDHPPTRAFAVRCLAEAHHVPFPAVRNLAKLVNGLVSYLPAVGVLVVDAVLEDVRLGLEENAVQLNQRRIATVHYLGELYNYCLVDNSVVFDVLYLLVSFGVSTPLDPPENLFRIRLVTVLLNASGRFFDAGPTGRKLDCFLTFYQNYFWAKRADAHWAGENGAFPVMVEALYADTIAKLRPDVRFCRSFEESWEAVERLRQELAREKPEVYDVCDEPSAVQRAPYDEAEPYGADEESKTEFPADVENPSSHDDDGTKASPRGLSAEDEAFRAAFERIVSENVHERLGEPARQVDISVPTTHARVNAAGGGGGAAKRGAGEEGAIPCMDFVLMTRRGNKPQFRTLRVPLDSDLAINLRHTEEVERLERERLKQLTLDISERLEEEEYRETVAADQRAAEGRQKGGNSRGWQHQRGAPDTDHIFGMWLPR